MDTLLGAGIAGVFALLGVYLTQRHERSLSDREEQRQRLSWARDDVARSYEHRREVYLEFTQQWSRHYDAAFQYREILDGPEPDYDWMDSVHDAYVQLQVFGTRAAVEAAKQAVENLEGYARAGKDLDYTRYEQVLEEVRRDLGIPDEPLSLPAVPSRRQS